MNKILRPMCKYMNIYPLKETKRFAGHSKWANIKHTKAVKDADKAVMTDKHLKQMRAAIAEGGSAFPEHNMKLAYLIEQAKKKNIPNGTVKALLDKMQSTKVPCQNVWINVQGPNGCLLVFHLVSDNAVLSKHHVNTMLKKNMCKLADGPVKSVFNVEGVILTEKFCDIDAATDIGIEVGAEDVSEMEKNGQTFLRFTCNPTHMMEIKRKLDKLGHPVISAEEEYIPHTLIEVSDEGIDYVNRLIEKVKATGELIQVYDNIA